MPAATTTPEELAAGLPGSDIVLKGLREVRSDDIGECGMLVLIACLGLNALGLEVPDRSDILPPLEHRLYELLETTHPRDAYSRYNALMRTLASFIHALEHHVDR